MEQIQAKARADEFEAEKARKLDARQNNDLVDK